jgi:hypothetical protein
MVVVAVKVIQYKCPNKTQSVRPEKITIIPVIILTSRIL